MSSVTAYTQSLFQPVAPSGIASAAELLAVVQACPVTSLNRIRLGCRRARGDIVLRPAQPATAGANARQRHSIRDRRPGHAIAAAAVRAGSRARDRSAIRPARHAAPGHAVRGVAATRMARTRRHRNGRASSPSSRRACARRWNWRTSASPDCSWRRPSACRPRCTGWPTSPPPGSRWRTCCGASTTWSAN